MQKKIEKHIVSVVQGKIRVSDYLVEKFEIISTRKGIKKALKNKRILHNGVIANSGSYVCENDNFELLEDFRKPPKIFPLTIDVVYEDDYLAIVNKPAGIPVSGNKYKTLVNCLGENLTLSTQKDVLPWFQPIHRLDVPTSGLVIVAKTYDSRVKLGEMLEKKEIQKVYRAVVQGYFKGLATLTSSINGKHAISEVKSLKQVSSKRNKYLTLLELSPITGRTHQLRIHTSRLGFPIVGDKEYGVTGNIMKHKGLFLAAIKVEFSHPILNKKVVALIEQPPKFNALLAREERNYSTPLACI